MSGGGGMVCTKRMANPISHNKYYVNCAILFNHYKHLTVLQAMQFLQTTRCSGCPAVWLLAFRYLHMPVSRA